jgi:hypothetical protein
MMDHVTLEEANTAAEIERGAWIFYQAQKFQDSIINGKISFVEGENGTHTRECPIKLLLATSPCASLKP